MKPTFLDEMSWAMAEVYGAVTDKILVNLAKYFPYIRDSGKIKGSFEYQARMLAQVGQINRETEKIILDSLDSADAALRGCLEAAILNALRTEEPKLREAARRGLLASVPPEVTPNMMQAFRTYYSQSADKLNLVNTVMLESTQSAYAATVSDVVQKIERTQSVLNVAAGEVVTGVSTYNQVMHDAVRKMVKNGLTGLIDHAGRRWSPEAYVAMDVRTTLFNTSRAAVWERADEYGEDLYQVSSHNGARPLCYPWQGKVLSRTGRTGVITDLDGNEVVIHSQDEVESFGYGGGLFGVNCGHYPIIFIPGVSKIMGEPQDPAENEKAYAESQEQRALERKLREERRELAIMKAQGADEQAIAKQKAKVDEASDNIDAFCDATGRHRRKDREYTPINAKFPPQGSYDPSTFPTDQRDKMQEFFSVAANTTTGNPAAQNTNQQAAASIPTNTGANTVYTIQQATKTEQPFVVNPGTTSEVALGNADVYTMPDGTQFVFQQGMDKSKQVLTPEEVVSRFYKMPEQLRVRAQKTVCVVDVYNPNDSYWARTYKSFTHSFATGGEMITFWRFDGKYDLDYLLEAFGHEMGHRLDRVIGNGIDWFSELQEWADAMAHDKDFSGGVAESVSDYGKNSAKEDFAESVKKFVLSKTGFAAAFPNRAKILERLIYGGGRP